MSSYTQFETVSKSILGYVTFSVTNEITRMLSTDVVHFVLIIKVFVSNGLKNWRKAGWSCSSRDESFRLRRIVLVSRLATSSKAIHAQGQSVVSVLRVPYDRRKEKERNSSWSSYLDWAHVFYGIYLSVFDIFFKNFYNLRHRSDELERIWRIRGNLQIFIEY